MDLFNSYRDPFLYDEDEETEEADGTDDDDPKKPDPDDEDDILKEPDESGATDWEER